MTYSNFARTSSQCSEIDLFFNVGKGLSLQKFLCSGSFLCFYHVPHVPIGICLYRGVRGVWIIIGMACRLFTVTFISMIWFLLYNKLLFTNKAVLVVCSKYDDVEAFLTCTSRVQLQKGRLSLFQLTNVSCLQLLLECVQRPSSVF